MSANAKRARGRVPQKKRPAGATPPPPIEQMVIPRGRCTLPHKKLRFEKADAPKALKQAQAARIRKGQREHMEKRAYQCPACELWHLTSLEKPPASGATGAGA